MSVFAPTKTAHRTAGLRRLDPMTDLADVADLIEQAFFEDLDHEGHKVLKELRQLSRWGVVLWLLRVIGPEFEDVLSGFVWQQDDSIVGNVSVNVIGHVFSNWRISNVAVEPSYRRRGIARQLMEETIDYVQRKGGKTIYLQVREDNAPALMLYRSLGFQTVTAETEMYLLPGSIKSFPDGVPSDGAVVRSLNRKESSQIYSLALETIPKADQRLTPVNQIDFEVDRIQEFSEKLTYLTNGRRTYRFVVDGRSELAAFAKLITTGRGRGPHRFSLLVHPNYQGQVETALVGTILRTLAHHPQSEIQTRLNSSKTQEIEALTSFGFLKRRTLVTMELHLRT